MNVSAAPRQAARRLSMKAAEPGRKRMISWPAKGKRDIHGPEPKNALWADLPILANFFAVVANFGIPR
jgi:hypothetical protein